VHAPRDKLVALVPQPGLGVASQKALQRGVNLLEHIAQGEKALVDARHVLPDAGARAHLHEDGADVRPVLEHVNGDAHGVRAGSHLLDRAHAHVELSVQEARKLGRLEGALHGAIWGEPAQLVLHAGREVGYNIGGVVGARQEVGARLHKGAHGVPRRGRVVVGNVELHHLAMLGVEEHRI